MMVNSCLGMDGYIVMRWGWISVSRQLSSQPTTTTGHSLSAATCTVETQTSLVTVTEDKSLDYEDMSGDENEDGSPTEIGQMLDESTGGFEDPRLSEEDVALDMDEVVVETEELEELYDSDDNGDSESGGLAGD